MTFFKGTFETKIKNNKILFNYLHGHLVGVMKEAVKPFMYEGCDARYSNAKSN